MQILADPQYLAAAGMDKPVDTFVKGAVGISGVYNIVRLANTSFYGTLVTNPPFGERVEQWREASIGMTATRVGSTSPLTKMPLLLVNAQEDFHFQEDAQELERWLAAAGNVRSVKKTPSSLVCHTATTSPSSSSSRTTSPKPTQPCN